MNEVNRLKIYIPLALISCGTENEFHQASNKKI